MSITLTALSSSTPSLYKTNKFLPLNACPRRNHISHYPSSLTTLKLQLTHKYSGLFGRNYGFPLIRKNGFITKAEIDERGESTLPDRFRIKEPPEKLPRWPFLIALPFLLYAWRAVFRELLRWSKVVPPVHKFPVYLLKLAVASVYYSISNPVTALIRAFESTFYSIRAIYSGIVAYAPIQELTTVIILASCVLAIAEAAVPDSVNNQPYLLTAAGIIGFAAVRNYISELFFWLLLLGSFLFARFIKKRDYVSASLPAAAVLAAVGEPWVRMVVIVSFTALAVLEHYKNALNQSEGETTGVVENVPFPLICAALAIGVRLAAKWAGYRHLTWMIV